MSVHFTRIANDNDQPTERGTYSRVREYWADYLASRGRPNTYWAEICCPGCGRVGLVGSNHTVADDGTVSPSDVCPFSPCTFHEFIVLDDVIDMLTDEDIEKMRSMLEAEAAKRSTEHPPH